MMNKISKLFKALSLLLSNPSLLNEVLDSPLNRKKEFLKQYALSCGLDYVHLADLINENSLHLNNYSYQGGNSFPTDLILLKKLCEQKSDCNYFEIGTWRGESAIAVADSCRHCYTLNLSNQEMEAIGLEKDYINQHEIFSRSNPKITHLKGDSTKFDFSPYFGKMDVVFVDGNHHYDFVLNDTKAAFKLLKDENSVIVWHDYTKNGEDIRWDILKAILDGSDERNRKYIYQVKDTMSAIYTKKNIPTHPNSFWKAPKYSFDIQLNIRPLQ